MWIGIKTLPQMDSIMELQRTLENNMGRIIWWTCIKVHLNHPSFFWSLGHYLRYIFGPSIVYSFDLHHWFEFEYFVWHVFNLRNAILCAHFPKCKFNDMFGVMMAKLCEIASSTKKQRCHMLQSFRGFSLKFNQMALWDVLNIFSM